MRSEKARTTKRGLQAEMAAGDLGDDRLNARRDCIIDALERHPAVGFPEACGTEAATEAFYRFLRNPRVTLPAILAPHIEATVARCQAVPEVVVIHDTTENTFAGEGARGELTAVGPRRQSFWLHTSLAVSTDGGHDPLGVLALAPWVRAAPRPDRAPYHWRARFRDPAKESARWAEGVATCRARLGPAVHAIHLMDREGDSYELLSELVATHERFVIRVNYDRSLVTERQGAPPTILSARPATPWCERTVAVSARRAGDRPQSAIAHWPVRRQRVAQLQVSAAAVVLKRPCDYPSHLPTSLRVHIVYAWEPQPPAGEPALEWRLVTTEPIDTVADAVRVIELYRTRWLIEEYFKCLKTGCAYERRQLESFRTLLVALGLFAPIAWQLLRLRHVARLDPPRPAQAVLTRRQVTLLRATRAGRGLSAAPSAREALLVIGRLGGHLRNNGDPGWLVLTRGMRTLHDMEVGWMAATRSDQS